MIDWFWFFAGLISGFIITYVIFWFFALKQLKKEEDELWWNDRGITLNEEKK